jgi:hypothetical protein
MTDRSTTSSAPPPFVPVSKEDIVAFADKLIRWGTTLAPKEQALVQVIVDRARGLIPDDVRNQQLRIGLSAAMQSVYASCASAWNADAPQGWVRTDPIWYKSGPTDDGEQIDITVRLTVLDATTAASSSPATSTTAASPMATPPTAAPAGSSAVTTSKLPVAMPSRAPAAASPTNASAVSAPAPPTPRTKA